MFTNANLRAKILSFVLLIGIMISLVPSMAFASGETVKLAGVVTDADGNAVPGATVTISNGTTLTTDANGCYSTTIEKDAVVNVTVSKNGHNTRSINGVSYNSAGNAFWKPRKPTFSFTFDDGNPTDANVKKLFDDYGLKCGFAIVAKKDDYSTYLGWENEGFEILSHSTDSKAMNGFSSDEHASDEERLFKVTEAKRILTEAGFKNIRSWVAPSSVMKASIIDDILLHYDYAFGRKNGDTEYIFTPDNLPSYGRINRYSVESNTPDAVFAMIDETIAKNGILSFYAHKYPDESKLTEENAIKYLDYLKAKADAGEIDILTPTEAADKYFKTVTCDVTLIDGPVMAVHSVDAQANSLSFKVSTEVPSGEEITGKILTALYGKNDMLISVKPYDAASEVEVSFDTQGDFAKVFWWNESTLAPLSKSLTITDLPGEPVPDDDEGEDEGGEEGGETPDYTYHPETAYSQYALLWGEDFTNKTALDTYDPAGVNTTGSFATAGSAKTAPKFTTTLHKNITGDDSDNFMFVNLGSCAVMRGIKNTASAKVVTMAEGVFEFDSSFAAKSVTNNTQLVIGANMTNPGSDSGPNTPAEADFSNGFRMYFNPTGTEIYLQAGDDSSATSFTSPVTLPFVNVTNSGVNPAWARFRITLIPKNDTTTEITAYVALYADGKRSGALQEYKKIGSVEMETALLKADSKKADNKKWTANAVNTSVAAGADNEVDSIIRFVSPNKGAHWAIDNIKYYGPVK